MANIRNEDEDEDFIVQNITQGHHCVSDGDKNGLNMTFEPYEIRDLTWHDRKKLRSSISLRKSLQGGFLKRITAEERDMILDRQAMRQEKELNNTIKQQKMQSVQIGDSEMEAESINLASGASGRANQEAATATAGRPNDPATYAKAYQMAASRAQREGITLLAEDFAEIIKTQFNGELPQDTNNINFYKSGVTSGDARRGRATIISAPVNDEGSTSVSQFYTTNYNRDGQLAGSDATWLRTASAERPDLNVQIPQPNIQDSYYRDSEDSGVGESIDLADDSTSKGTTGQAELDDQGVKHPRVKRARK